MATIRTGTDLAAVEDVVAGITAHGERYLSRVFTPRERADTGDDPSVSPRASPARRPC
ncbi:hypothetical protein P9139_13065 [Curtobacterium flaccumfaciens]|nr:hypothetical protein P9139_13065 [Curtobacterium flaccumfaciens]